MICLDGTKTWNLQIIWCLNKQIAEQTFLRGVCWGWVGG